MSAHIRLEVIILSKKVTALMHAENKMFGTWRRLVMHLTDIEEYESSILSVPTIIIIWSYSSTGGAVRS